MNEEDLLPLSLIQHLVYCERRAALVCLERAWSDNEYTVLGQYVHDRVDVPSVEMRGNIRIVRGLRVRSFELGLFGIADCVEFDGERVFPVEYKSGRLRSELSFEAQLCAQALCLEEMLDVRVPDGAIYYGKTKRRYDVEFCDGLRDRTCEAARRLHDLVQSNVTPGAKKGRKCKKCSLADGCMPGLGSVSRYCQWVYEEREHEGY